MTVSLERVVTLVVDRVIKITIDRSICYFADYIYGEYSEELIQSDISKPDYGE